MIPAVYIVFPWETPHILDESGSSEVIGSKTFCGLVAENVGLASTLPRGKKVCSKCKAARARGR